MIEKSPSFPVITGQEWIYALRLARPHRNQTKQRIDEKITTALERNRRNDHRLSLFGRDNDDPSLPRQEGL